MKSDVVLDAVQLLERSMMMVAEWRFARIAENYCMSHVFVTTKGPASESPGVANGPANVNAVNLAGGLAGSPAFSAGCRVVRMIPVQPRT